MMTARWRTVLRMRAVLRLLLTDHVPLGAMSRVVELVRRVSDEELVNENRTPSMTAALARDILHELLGDDVELIDRDTPSASAYRTAVETWHGQPDPRPPGEPRDLLRIGDELRRRIQAAKLASETSIDAPAAAVHDELVELLAFVLPLQGAPLPDVERFEQYLEGEGFYNLMQAYRHANAVVQTEVSAAFETIKTVLREQVRR
jgi:hypothetical protein